MVSDGAKLPGIEIEEGNEDRITRELDQNQVVD